MIRTGWFATRSLWTHNYGMAEAGFLRAGDRVELIDGEIVDGRQLAKTTKLSFVVLPALWQLIVANVLSSRLRTQCA